MNATNEIVVGLPEFAERWDGEVGAFLRTRGFVGPYAWEFAGDSSVAYERSGERIVTSCDRRVASIETYIEPYRTIGTYHLWSIALELSDEFDYPGGAQPMWTGEELEERLALESSVLRRSLDPFLRSLDLIETLEGEYTKARSCILSDRVDTFPRDGAARFGFLEHGGFVRELAEGGSTVMYRRGDAHVRIELAWTLHTGHEESPDWELNAAVARNASALLPWGDEWDYLDVDDRVGRFTAAYLDRALAQAEAAVRNHPLVVEALHG